MTRSSAKVVLLSVLLALALVGGAFSTIRGFEISGRISSDERVDTLALCSLRADVRQRVRATTDFLRTHPAGIPGVPIGALRVSLDNERHSLYALRVLAGYCK